MFDNVRRTLFIEPDKPETDEFVHKILKEKNVDTNILFEALRDRPWHNSFLNAEENFSTILDEYVEELSEISIKKSAALSSQERS